MAREIDEDKAFEQELKGRMGWKCPVHWISLIKNHH